jgi:hypothetical protein
MRLITRFLEHFETVGHIRSPLGTLALLQSCRVLPRHCFFRNLDSRSDASIIGLRW